MAWWTASSHWAWSWWRSGSYRHQSTRVQPNSSTNRQIRSLVLYVHAMRLSTVCAAQVRGGIQPVRQSPVVCWLVDCHADCHYPTGSPDLAGALPQRPTVTATETSSIGSGEWCCPFPPTHVLAMPFQPGDHGVDVTGLLRRGPPLSPWIPTSFAGRCGRCTQRCAAAWVCPRHSRQTLPPWPSIRQKGFRWWPTAIWARALRLPLGGFAHRRGHGDTSVEVLGPCVVDGAQVPAHLRLGPRQRVDCWAWLWRRREELQGEPDHPPCRLQSRAEPLSYSFQQAAASGLKPIGKLGLDGAELFHGGGLTAGPVLRRCLDRADQFQPALPGSSSTAHNAA